MTGGSKLHIVYRISVTAPHQYHYREGFIQRGLRNSVRLAQRDIQTK